MPTVFISHSNLDRDIVEREIVEPLRDVGIETWFSDDNIQTASAWERSIREALRTCEWFLVALTRNSVASEWVQAEVDWALEQRPNRVIQVMLDDCNPDDLHLKLRRLQHVDLRGSTARGRAKLVAAFIDVAGAGQPRETARAAPTGAPTTRAAHPPASTPVQTPGPPPLPPPPLPRRRPVWPWVLAGVGVVLVLVIVIAAAYNQTPASTQTQPSAPGAAAPATDSSGLASAAAIRTRLDRRVARYYTNEGTPAFSDIIGFLTSTDSAKAYNLDLTAGTTYTFIGVCDADCSDLDLRLYHDGNQVVADTAMDAIPVLSVVPPTSARQQLAVTLPKCQALPCWFGVRILSR